jgi:selenocysteine lyase/cysteine desulfurase
MSKSGLVSKVRSKVTDTPMRGLNREAFPILRDGVYFDVAYKASVPDSVRAAVASYFDENQSSAGDKVAWARRIDKLRANSAKLIGASADEIAFVKNASEGINLFAHSVDFRSGDNVVISDQEHAANLYPWTNLSRRGVGVRHIKSKDYTFSTDDIIALIDSRTRVVALSLVCQVSGFIPDIAAIAEFCRPRGIRVFLDAMQAVGTIPVRVKELGIDGLATSGHKWLLGPYGTGFIYADREFSGDAIPVFSSKHYTRIELEDPNTSLLGDAGKWEYGSLNYPGLFGLAAGVDMILELGDSKISIHTEHLIKIMRERARSIGLRAITPGDRGRGISGIISFSCQKAEEAASFLRAQKIFVSSRRGMLRASLHFYNSAEDIERFIATLPRNLGS